MLITMSTKELERTKILQDVVDRRMRKCDAAKRLNIFTRPEKRKPSIFTAVSCCPGPAWAPPRLLLPGAILTGLLVRLVCATYKKYV